MPRGKMISSDDVSDSGPIPPSCRAPRWVVTVESNVRRGRVPRQAIRRAVAPLGAGEACRGCVRVVVVGDSYMRRLNRTFRNKNRSTDVLAFPLDSSFPVPAESGLIGEVYCNYDHSRRWSRRYGGTITAELSRLAVHGCLHLVGYDHHEPAGRRQMTAAENRYLRAAGLLESRSE